MSEENKERERGREAVVISDQRVPQACLYRADTTLDMLLLLLLLWVLLLLLFALLWLLLQLCSCCCSCCCLSAASGHVK